MGRAKWTAVEIMVSIAASLALGLTTFMPFMFSLDAVDWYGIGGEEYSYERESRYLPIPMTVDVAVTPEPPVPPSPDPPAEASRPPAPPARDGVPATVAETDDDGLADLAPPPVPRPRTPGHRPPQGGNNKGKKPCTTEPNPGVVQVDDTHWTIAREVLEHYASHPRELEDLGGVRTHTGPDGQDDGFRVGVPRCGLLHQAGLRSGDIVHSVDGRTISTVMQAVRAYFALRRETEITLVLTRKGQDMTLTYTILGDEPDLTADEKQQAREQARAERQGLAEIKKEEKQAAREERKEQRQQARDSRQADGAPEATP